MNDLASAQDSKAAVAIRGNIRRCSFTDFYIIKNLLRAPITHIIAAPAACAIAHARLLIELAVRPKGAEVVPPSGKT